MKEFELIPDGSQWKLMGSDGKTVASYANKPDALRGAAKRVSKECGKLKIYRAGQILEEERIYHSLEIRSEDGPGRP